MTVAGYPSTRMKQGPIVVPNLAVGRCSCWSGRRCAQAEAHVRMERDHAASVPTHHLPDGRRTGAGRNAVADALTRSRLAPMQGPPVRYDRSRRTPVIIELGTCACYPHTQTALGSHPLASSPRPSTGPSLPSLNKNLPCSRLQPILEQGGGHGSLGTTVLGRKPFGTDSAGSPSLQLLGLHSRQVGRAAVHP